MNAKISIIIPVYNVEKYLNQCLESVINQTMAELEIICVNDGSTDRSPQILKEFAQKDDRITIINKENGGIASARNRGLEYATGEYIGFVDSDDWIEPHMYDKLYKNAEKHDSDMVMCPTHLFDETKQELSYNKPYFTLECFNENFDDINFDHSSVADFLFDINVTPWNKIYRGSFLKENNINFPEGLDFEDNLFFYESFLNAEKVSLVRDPLYFYRINREGSFINSGNKRFFDIMPIMHLIESTIRKKNPEYLDSFLNIKISTVVSRYNQVDEKYKQDFLEIIKENFALMDPDDINKLNDLDKTTYEKVMKSSTYREYDLYEQIGQLEKSLEEKLNQQSLKFKGELEHQRESFNDKIKSKNQIIEELKSSNSWKITKPIRKVSSAFKKLIN